MRYFIYGMVISIVTCSTIIIVRGIYLWNIITKYMKSRGLTEMNVNEIYNFLDSK